MVLSILSDLQFIGVAIVGMAGAASVVLGALEQHTSIARLAFLVEDG